MGMELKAFDIGKYVSSARYSDAMSETPVNIEDAKVHMTEDEKMVLDQIIEMRGRIGGGSIYPQTGIRVIANSFGVTTILMNWKYN